MGETSKEKAAFIIRYGIFQFEVMPFGLMNSQCIFQKMTDRTLLNVASGGYYIDNDVVF